MAAGSAPVLNNESIVDELDRLRLSLRTLQAQNATLRQLVAIHDRLGALVLLGADIATITTVLAELIGRPENSTIVSPALSPARSPIEPSRTAPTYAPGPFLASATFRPRPVGRR